MHEVCSCGFPHSDISGSKPMCGSPELFAACRVLRRLPVPRHPPCALLRLTNKSFDLFVLRFLAFYARTLLRSFPYVRRSFPAVLIFCYLNDNASIDVLRRSFLLLRLPILRVHKLPLFSFSSCSARLSYMRFSRCVTEELFGVEMRGFEPLTPCLQGRCSPN